MSHPSSRAVQLVHGPAGDLELDRFRVYSERQLQIGGATAHLRVIGESSLVTIQTGAGAWFELITCGAGEEPGPCRISLKPQAGSVGSLASAQPGCAYQGRIWSEPLGEMAAPSPLRHSLEFRFPGPGDPLTRIEMEPGPAGLWLRTRHDYPENGVVIWSESRWRFGTG